MSSTPRTLCLLVLLATLSGCVIVQSGSRTKYTGHHVSSETLAQVRPGATQEFVLALIGQPTSKTALEDGSAIWKWSYTRTETSSGSFIILFSGSSSTESHGAAYIEFTPQALVARSWSD